MHEHDHGHRRDIGHVDIQTMALIGAVCHVLLLMHWSAIDLLAVDGSRGQQHLGVERGAQGANSGLQLLRSTWIGVNGHVASLQYMVPPPSMANTLPVA